MESTSSANQGEGVPPSFATTEVVVATEVVVTNEVVASPEVGSPSQLSEEEAQYKCQFTSPTGRHCNMAIAPGSDLCAHHARILAPQQSQDEPEITDATAKHLLDGVEDFEDADEVKLFLRNVVKQVVRRRIGRRDAVTLAYLCQLILNCEAITLSQMRDEDRREAAQALIKAKTKQPLKIIWDIPGPNRKTTESEGESS